MAVDHGSNSLNRKLKTKKIHSWHQEAKGRTDMENTPHQPSSMGRTITVTWKSSYKVRELQGEGDHFLANVTSQRKRHLIWACKWD